MPHYSQTAPAQTASNRVALVSGAASGIGLATVRLLAGAGWTTYAGFRPGGRSAAPTDLASAVHWLSLDVTEGESRQAALELIRQRHGRLDALVNNAGIAAPGPLEEVPAQALRRVMEVNFFGAIELTRTFLPLMRGRGAVIVMVSSLSGLIGLPFDGAYAASKFALEGASESLRYELEPSGVRVALIEPGAYATALDASTGAPAHTSAYPAFERLRADQPAAGSGGADPAEAAQVILETILAGAPHLRVPAGAQALGVTQRLRVLEGAERREFALAAAGIRATDP
ncbi:MAG: SDR family oxidoreductase [Proteobacteria bacterium]|nr:SDR family oxidoreductase [Pseudomonadota bacterium]